MRRQKENVANNTLIASVVEEFIENNKLVHRKMCAALQRTDTRLRITGTLCSTWSVPCISVDITPIKEEVNNFLTENKLLGPITPQQIQHGVHFVRRGGHGEIVFYMCIITAELNGCRTKNIVSIEWLVNAEKDHFASTVVEFLKKKVHARRQKCFLITQCAQKRDAIKFWNGKMTKSSKADALVGLMHIYLGLELYEGPNMMA